MSTAVQRGKRAILIAIILTVVGVVAVIASDSIVRIDAHAAMTPARAEREELMAWLARLLLALGVGWLLIGIIATRTSLVRRPGAAAARSTWLSFSRPWRARESMLGLLAFDRWLLIVIPAGMLIATHLIAASFLSVIPVLIASAGWFIFGFFSIVLIWPRSSWPVIAAVSGTAIFWCLIVLAGIAVWGPGTYWLVLWRTPGLRIAVLAVVLATFAWAMMAAGGAMNQQVGAKAATGVVIASAGATTAFVSLAVGVLGPKWLGAQLQDSTIELTLDESIVWAFVIGGAVLFFIGIAVTITARRQPPQRSVGGSA